MRMTVVSTFKRNCSSRNPGKVGFREFVPGHLVAAVVAITMFIGSTAAMGFGQAADNSAAATYKTNCASCHAADGHGSAVGKSLHAADFHSAQVQDQTDAQLASVIAQGRGNMPGFGSSLSKDQIDSLVKYIRTFKDAK